MSNNLQKAFFITSILYVLMGGLVAFSVVNFTQNESENCSKVCLTCFKEVVSQPKQEIKQETKQIKKIAKKEPLSTPVKETQKEEQKPNAQYAQSSASQAQKIEETSANPQKQYNDKNSNKIREVLIKHANNSYAQKARNMGITGACKISFVLHPDGTVGNKEISDCHMWLKSSAKMAIEDAAPELPKPHENCKITTSIDYEIIKN